MTPTQELRARIEKREACIRQLLAALGSAEGDTPVALTLTASQVYLLERLVRSDLQVLLSEYASTPSGMLE